MRFGVFLRVENICSAKATYLVHKSDIQTMYRKYFSLLVVIVVKVQNG